MNLPPFRPSLFWDADLSAIDIEDNAQYIIERILDLGNDDEIRWMWRQYPKNRISDIVHTSRALHKKSKAFWELLV